MIGTGEIILILIVVLLLFGAKKLPELARGLGTGLKEFKKSMSDVQEPINEIKKEIDDTKNIIRKEIDTKN